MSKHTPWHTKTDLFGALHVYDSGGDRLTNDCMSGNEKWPETARLIAAAPELLEALKLLKFEVRDALVGTFGDMPDDPFDELQAIKKARTAIAKAEGKQ